MHRGTVNAEVTNAEHGGPPCGAPGSELAVPALAATGAMAMGPVAARCAQRQEGGAATPPGSHQAWRTAPRIPRQGRGAAADAPRPPNMTRC